MAMLHIYVSFDVTSRNPLVHVRTIWAVEYFSPERILVIVCNVIIHHDDDVVLRDAVSMEHLIGVTEVGLVPVVLPAARARRQHRPLLPRLPSDNMDTCVGCQEADASQCDKDHGS